MNLFSPARPATADHRPMLLGEPSAVPGIYIFPASPTAIQLSVYVRDLSDTKNRSYTYRQAIIAIVDLPTVIQEYIEDPELTLRSYFLWPSEAGPTVAITALEDLL